MNIFSFHNLRVFANLYSVVSSSYLPNCRLRQTSVSTTPLSTRSSCYTKTYQSSILLPFFHFAIQDKSMPTKVPSFLRPCGCTFDVFFISFLLYRPFSTCMKQNVCTNCICIWPKQGMSKNHVIENVLRSLARGEAANRAPSKIPPSTKSCSTGFVDRYRELDRALTGS